MTALGRMSRLFRFVRQPQGQPAFILLVCRGGACEGE
jgi:hypothetical protein